MSRKWKKKHGLLRRQHRRLFKDFGKALYKIIRVARKTGDSIAKLGEAFLKSGLTRPINEFDQYALCDALYTADLIWSGNKEATDDE